MPAVRTNAEKRWIGKAVGRGCIVCRNLGYGASPAEWHHIREGQGAAQRAGNFLAIALCPNHHRLGGSGVAIHAGQKTWENLYGTELDLLDQTIEELA